MAEKLSPVTQWILAAFLTVVMAFCGYYAHNMDQTVTQLSTVISAHVALPGHPVSLTKLETLERERSELRQELSETQRLLRQVLAKRMAGLPLPDKGDS